ncbi:MAG: hypothetical protein CMD02_04320 [Flavobacteriales bacterium]|nr:hypothetical protein [Flavobacteriales bacterium]
MIFYRNFKDFVLSFKYPYGKVFLVSYPNSGRSWLNYMLLNVLKTLEIQDINIQLTHDQSEIILENGFKPDPLLLYKYPNRYKYLRSRVIFLARDPRDIIASNFYQVTNRSKFPFNFDSISDFVKHDVYGFKRIIYFYNLWNNNKNIPVDFKLVKYENLLNGIDEFKKVLSFLNIKINDDIVSNIYMESSADKMRKKEKENTLDGITHFGTELDKLKVRHATKGSFRNDLSNNDILYCNNEMKKLSSFFKYF